MRHTVRAVAVLVLALGAAPLAAQNPGLPVYNLGRAARHRDLRRRRLSQRRRGQWNRVRRDGARGVRGPRRDGHLSALDPEGPAGSDVSVGGTLNYGCSAGPWCRCR